MSDVEYEYGPVFISCRKIRDMQLEIFDQEFYYAINTEKEVYYTVEWCSEPMEYELLLMPAYRLGAEWVKTTGVMHDHYEELKVLAGEAHVLIQKMEDDVLLDIARFTLRVNDALTILNGRYHIIINPSLTEPLVLTAKRDIDTESESELTVRKKGMAYYELINGGFVWNTEYGPTPSKSLLRLVDSHTS